ncbi:MAG: DEAD/DEAH box helicase [Sporichthyaceae bacterium]
MFTIGQLVSLRADAGEVGSIVAELADVDGVARYRVFHGIGRQREYSADQLLPVSAAVGEASADLGEFQARLTAARLRQPTDDQLGSLGSARIDFNPFQYRPVLRLLRADEPRLLIADDVGVGKTIEAGLILKELASRRPLERVLIACPKSLTSKWRTEMRTKFDETFRILTSEGLKYCLRETNAGGVWPEEYRRCIVHYELLRLERYLNGADDKRGRVRGLTELEPPPFFDLVIADEAHHMRNPASNVHAVAQFLADNSEALVLLSATPIQLRRRDLHTLVRLLRPLLYPDLASLDLALEPNKFLTRASRALRTGDVDAENRATLQGHLAEAVATPWGRTTIGVDPRFQELARRLDDPRTLEVGERVRAARTIEELHALAHLMNRTRRRDITTFTVREPVTCSVAFTAGQKAAYERLLELRAEQLRERHSNAVAKLLLDSLERQASSCLPALLAALGPDAAAEFRLEDYADTPEDWDGNLDEDTMARLTKHPLHGHPDLAGLLRTAGREDPKFDTLRQIVGTAVDGAGPGKVLVFSFFLHTLAYLRARLQAAGIRVGVVSGKVDETDRQALRDRFALPRDSPGAIDVLLSSEVGCEGLDYQFCDRLVNYDIPWNPMRVEQRIGRIDRYGQASPKVMIYNFVTPGTVEERVWNRCFERLGIFRDAIGDIDGVLGELVQTLTEISLDPALTAAQQEERARQEVDNAERRLAEESALEDASHELLGWDESLMQDFQALQDTGQCVSPAQLLALVRRFLDRPDVQAAVTGDEAGTLQVKGPKAARAAIAARISGLPGTKMSDALREWLSGDGGAYRLCLDGTGDAQRLVDLLTAEHPLVAAAVADLAPAQGEELVLRAVATDPGLRPGRYAFSWEIWRVHAVRPQVRTVLIAVDERSGEAAPDVEARLMALLTDDTGRLTATDGGSGPSAEADHRAERLRRQELVEAEATNAVHLARRREAWTAQYTRQRAALEALLATVSEGRIARMNAGRIARLDAENVARMNEFAGRTVVDIYRHRMAYGVLEVRSGD